MNKLAEIEKHKFGPERVKRSHILAKPYCISCAFPKFFTRGVENQRDCQCMNFSVMHFPNELNSTHNITPLISSTKLNSTAKFFV